jgi:hypothetical protein
MADQNHRIFNTFVAWVIRQAPGLNAALPNIAIGKDYLADGVFQRFGLPVLPQWVFRLYGKYAGRC